MAEAKNDQDPGRAKRASAVVELLRDVPMPAEPADPKSRWLTAEKTKLDPRSVY
jgi:hypothetical protein